MLWTFKICLFSAIEGTVTHQGQPVADLEIVRKCVWRRSYDDETKDKKFQEVTRTDADGRFAFPTLERWTLNVWRLVEPVVDQQIHTHFHDQTIILWSTFKRTYRRGGELGFASQKIRLPIQIRCEMTDKPVYNVVEPRGIAGIGRIISEQAVIKELKHDLTTI